MSMQDMPDFSSSASTEVIKFRIDGDIFEAFADVGADIIMDVTKPVVIGQKENATQEELLEMAEKAHEFNLSCMHFLQEVLLPSSRDRFAERLRSATEPITVRQALDVYRFLIQQYSNRPTQPPASSSTGQGGTGTTSTDSARIVDLTPDGSALPGSLT